MDIQIFFGYRCPTALAMYKRGTCDYSRNHFLTAVCTYFSLVMRFSMRVRFLNPLTTVLTFFVKVDLAFLTDQPTATIV